MACVLSVAYIKYAQGSNEDELWTQDLEKLSLGGLYLCDMMGTIKLVNLFS